uniref:Uncharacterized protein n=1 Tax=Pithovirus LCPAC401 TaxID=2506595 RepID=A0A481ZD36_9VIRU|nr:MAG: uncharacterized protein LCPAC401_02290 [Pithovirus LCPAC401]
MGVTEAMNEQKILERIVDVLVDLPMEEGDEVICTNALEKMVKMMKNDEKFLNKVKDLVRSDEQKMNGIIVDVLVDLPMEEGDEVICSDALEKMLKMMKNDEKFLNKVKDLVRPDEQAVNESVVQ